MNERASALLAEFETEINWAAGKRYRRLRGAIPLEDLTAAAQECLCVIDGILPGKPSMHDKLDGWRKDCEGSPQKLRSYVLHALDWFLTSWVRSQRVREQRREQDLSIDLIPDSQARKARDDLQARWYEEGHAAPLYPSPVSTVGNPELEVLGDDTPPHPLAGMISDVWDRFPLLAQRYRDGRRIPDIAADEGISEAACEQRIRRQLARVRSEWAERSVSVN